LGLKVTLETGLETACRDSRERRDSYTGFKLAFVLDKAAICCDLCWWSRQCHVLSISKEV